MKRLYEEPIVSFEEGKSLYMHGINCNIPSEIIKDISFNDNFISWIGIHIIILFFASIVCFALSL